MDNFLVYRLKIGGVHTQKVAPEKHRVATNKEAQLDPID